MDTKDKDLELWRKWRQTRASGDLEALMAQLMPVLRREIAKGSNVVPAFVLEAEAKKLALQAFNTYDPNRVPPVALATHVTNALLKLKRTVYERQSTVSIPEHQRITYNNFVHVRASLEDQLGHPPTLDHIADHMGLPLPKLQSLVGNVEKRELLEHGEGPAFQARSDDDLIDLAYHDMTPAQKRVFEMRTGYRGHRVMKNPEIMKELGVTQGQLSYELGKIKALLETAQKRR